MFVCFGSRQRLTTTSFWSPPRGGFIDIAPSTRQTSRSNLKPSPPHSFNKAAIAYLSSPHTSALFIFDFASSFSYRASFILRAASLPSLIIHPFMSASSFMPIRSEPNAPSFEKATPCKLLKFFYELECLFHNAAIASEAEKKRHVLRYIDYELEQGWKCLFPEYAKATASYEDFRDAILVFYSVYSLRSMELLISDAQRVTLFTTSRLAEYHRQFLAITSWLIKKRQLEHSEQIRSYLRAFSPLIYLAITQHLQAKHPDHDIHVPYLITDVYDAAEFVLQSPLQCSPRTASPQPSKSTIINRILRILLTTSSGTAIKSPPISHPRLLSHRSQCMIYRP